VRVGPNQTVPVGFAGPYLANCPPSPPQPAPGPCMYYNTPAGPVIVPLVYDRPFIVQMAPTPNCMVPLAAPTSHIMYPPAPPHIMYPPAPTPPIMIPLRPTYFGSVTGPRLTERMSGRISRPLVPTVEPFQPASAHTSPVITNVTVNATEGSNSRISASQMPQAEKKPSRSLSAEVAPFMPMSDRMASASTENPADESEKKGLDDDEGQSPQQQEVHPFTSFSEEARLKEANSPVSSMQPGTQTDHPTEPESERDEPESERGKSESKQDKFVASLASPHSWSDTGRWPQPKISSKCPESLMVVPGRANPAPVKHANPETIYPSHVSDSTASPSDEYVYQYGHSQVNTGGPTIYGPPPLRLTTAEDEVRNRAAEQQAKLWQEAERIEMERLKMENRVAEERQKVQRVLEARQQARLERESHDFTRPEVISRYYQRRDDSVNRNVASRSDFESQAFSASDPWSEQPSPRLPGAHTRASNPATQDMVSSFEVAFDNMTIYKDGYTNHQKPPYAPPDMSSQMDVLPRHQPSWMPGPTQSGMNEFQDRRCTIPETSSSIQYTGPPGLNNRPRQPNWAPGPAQTGINEIPGGHSTVSQTRSFDPSMGPPGLNTLPHQQPSWIPGPAQTGINETPGGRSTVPEIRSYDPFMGPPRLNSLPHRQSSWMHGSTQANWGHTSTTESSDRHYTVPAARFPIPYTGTNRVPRHRHDWVPGSYTDIPYNEPPGSNIPHPQPPNRGPGPTQAGISGTDRLSTVPETSSFHTFMGPYGMNRVSRPEDPFVD